MISACGGGGVPPVDDGAATPAGEPGRADDEPGRADDEPGRAASEPGRAADPGPSIDGTRWTVDTVIAEGATVAVPAGPSGSAWLMIEGGTFFAVTGCGEVEGRVRVGDGHLRFSDVTHAIPVHCPEEFAQADMVMRDLLDSEATFAVEAGQLRLDHPSGAGLRLHAGPPPSPEA